MLLNNKLLMTEDDKKVWLFGVFTACPLSDAVKECIFQKYRKLNARERWSYIESMSEKEVNEYIKQHMACLNYRISSEQNICSHLIKDEQFISK